MLLDGYRVLDLTDHRGDLAAWLLGRLGADVVKVEPPGGSPARRLHPLVTDAPDGLQGLQFAAYNDNKRSIVLDLGAPADRAVLLDLVAGAEIMFDSGPPGLAAQAGLGEAELLAANPELVQVLVTPFGSDGPRAGQPCSELTLAALGGPMSLQGIRARAPVHVSVPQVWRHAGAEAALAALVGLARRDRTGQPQWIDLSAQAAMTWTMLNAMEAHEVQGFDFERAGATLSLAVTIDLKRAAKDGSVMAAPIGINTGPLVPWLIEEGIVDPSWAEQDWTTYDHRMLSGEPVPMDYDDLRRALDELCSRYTRHELLVTGCRYGATLAPVNSVADLLAFDHLEARRFWARGPLPQSAAPVRRVGGPITVDGVRPDQPAAIPFPDEHGARLRAEPRRRRRSPPDATRRGDEPPLAGVRVADFTWIAVGPITTKALADHGATVVRVETERRLDTTRAQAPFKDGRFGLNRSNFYGSFNTSKRSVTLDLTTDAGLAVAKRLTRWADVVIDSFRPGTMAKLGLAHEDIVRDNPSVITATTSLLGRGGPFSSLAGYGFHAAAIAGFTDLVGWPDLGPDGPWMAYTDTIAPRVLTTALLAALDARRRTGRGCHIEGAQLEIGLQLLAPELLDQQITGRVPTRNGNRDRHHAPQGAYPCAGQDEWCTLSVVDEDCWLALRRVLGEPDWAASERLATATGRHAAHDEIDEHLSRWTAGRSAEDVERILSHAGIPAGKVQRSRDLRVDPQYVHRGFYHHLEHSEAGLTPYAGHQYRIRGYDHGPRAAAPSLGEHTYEVLSGLLGMTDDEIAEVAAQDALR